MPANRSPSNSNAWSVRSFMTWAGAALCLACSSTDRSSDPPGNAIKLEPANAVLPEEFTFVAAVRELSDGRILVTDQRDKRLIAADLETGAIRSIARSGAGPGEYQATVWLFALAGDSTLMFAGDRRWLILDGDTVVATLPPDGPAITATAGALDGADRSGSVIAVRRPAFRVGAHTVGAADSIDLIRASLNGTAADTIARLRRDYQQINARANAKGEVDNVVALRPPFSVNEQALLFNDGWLAVVRLDPYRLEWRAPDGNWSRPPALDVPLIPVTDREKSAYFKRERKGPNFLDVWPTHIPPLVPAFKFSLFGLPDGKLLVRQPISADHPNTRYHIIDRADGYIGELVMEADHEVRGVGRESLYIVVTNSDGIQRIQRHRWPVAPSR